MRTLRLVFPYLLFLIAVAPSATAQMVGGTISGEVVDAAGAAVARALRCASAMMRLAANASF